MTTVSTTGNSYLDSLMTSTSKAASSSTTATGGSSQTINQSGFLKLLTTQLQTQDPTQATDTNQMVAQMATFSQVAGITEMNQSLATMSTNVAALRFGSASNWVGRAALVPSDIATQASNGAYAGQITVPSDAKDVTVSLTNASGQTVFSKDLGAQSAGAVNWSWDGKDSSGTATTDGALSVNVSAVGTSGGNLTTTNNTWNEISSVKSPTSGTTSLVTALGTIDPSTVLELS
ncbi:flagellar hook assembly protein FlgD [Sphingomonas nostoxanthinifaciens]|uniref:flagellar hook assembly protein FlgD n=1 Tax=Sphingomonas nostoxanthinifaciens TaxID=2872652 RepID=UPI001CC1E626|nr:flagellar hook capping FlgD N-terminal domain-containing protein [Sphingomonas nostoxanthinifaciens]UAK26057.1 flagellar hook capping protein [Sphingomonas nostoxanthinifaciens]